MANKKAWVQIKNAGGDRTTYSVVLEQPPLVNPVGQGVTSGVGTLVVQTADASSLVGIDATFGQGAPSVSTTRTVGVTLVGQAATSSYGAFAVVLPNKTAWVQIKNVGGDRVVYSVDLYQDPAVTLGTQAIITSIQVVAVTATSGAHVHVTGQSSSVQQGSVGVPSDNKRAWIQLKNSSGSRSTYSVSLYQDPAPSLTGQNIATAAGVLGQQSTDSAALTGISSTLSAGAITVRVFALPTPVGQATVGTTGTITVTPVQNISLNLVGQQTLIQQGTVVSSGSDGANLTGLASTLGQGSVAAQQGTFVSTTLGGVSSTTSAGTASASVVQNVSTSLSSGSIVSSLGTNQVTVDKSNTITGLGIVSSIGAPSLSIFTVITINLSGQAISSGAGSLLVQNSLPILGSSVASSKGTPTVTSNYVGYPITVATALTTADSGYQSLGFAPSDGDRSYWPTVVNSVSLVPETSSGNATGRIDSGPLTGNFTLIYFRLSGAIYYTIDVTLINGQASNIILTSQNIVSSIGTVSIVTTKAITGQEIASSIGSISAIVSADNTHTNGQQITSGQGIPTLALGSSVTLSGQSSTSTLGTLSIQTGSALVGVSGTFGQGSISVRVDVIGSNVNGLDIISGKGTLAVQTGSATSITGQTVTSGTGTPIVSNIANISPAISGQVIALGQGSTVESINSTVVFPGLDAFVRNGIIITSDRYVTISGQQLDINTNATLFALLYDIPNWITPHFVEAVLTNTNR